MKKLIETDKTPDAMTLSQYLGRGVVSRGRMTITPALVTAVTEHPYLHNAGDKEAVIQGIKNLQAALNVIPNITWVLPPPEGTVEDYVNGVSFCPELPQRIEFHRHQYADSSDPVDRLPFKPTIQPLDGHGQDGHG